jgi:hypothetical protein
MSGSLPDSHESSTEIDDAALLDDGVRPDHKDDVVASLEQKVVSLQNRKRSVNHAPLNGRRPKYFTHGIA